MFFILIPVTSWAQTQPSGGKAFLRSFLIPGWGQYSVQRTWTPRATLHLGSELGLWVGLISTSRRARYYVDAYERQAATQASAQLDGKSRTYLLNVANYESSAAYVSALRLARQWAVADVYSKPEYYWAWGSTTERKSYATLRDKADQMSRQRGMLIALIAGNHLWSAINAVRTTKRKSSAAQVHFGTDAISQKPVLRAEIRF